MTLKNSEHTEENSQSPEKYKLKLKSSLPESNELNENNFTKITDKVEKIGAEFHFEADKSQKNNLNHTILDLVRKNGDY